MYIKLVDLNVWCMMLGWYFSRITPCWVNIPWHFALCMVSLPILMLSHDYMAFFSSMPCSLMGNGGDGAFHEVSTVIKCFVLLIAFLAIVSHSLQLQIQNLLFRHETGKGNVASQGKLGYSLYTIHLRTILWQSNPVDAIYIYEWRFISSFM